VNAPRPKVYGALIDAVSIVRWKVPDGMTAEVHEFDARVGGAFRISLTYQAPSSAGKTSAQTDTYHGVFVELVPDERVVEVDEFETTDPALCGKMTITITLTDVGDGTEVVGLHEGLPEGVSLADNEAGWRMSLAKLATLVESS
jgi:uncharacterized protein YndB with AHSA1/START domain